MKKTRAWKWTKIIFCSLVISLIIRYSFFESFRMTSNQMEDAILPGDFLIVNKTAYGLKVPVYKDGSFSLSYSCMKPVKRNEVVLYRNNNEVLISRCVGLPGDLLEVKAFDYFINGKEIVQSPNTILPYRYVSEWDELVVKKMKNSNVPFRKSFDENGEKVRFFSKLEYYFLKDALPDSVSLPIYEKTTKDYVVKIPEGQYWMLSDNVNASADSRYVGFVPHADLIGKVAAVWFSKEPRTGVFYGYRKDRFFSSVSQ